MRLQLAAVLSPSRRRLSVGRAAHPAPIEVSQRRHSTTRIGFRPHRLVSRGLYPGLSVADWIRCRRARQDLRSTGGSAGVSICARRTHAASQCCG